MMASIKSKLKAKVFEKLNDEKNIDLTLDHKAGLLKVFESLLNMAACCQAIFFLDWSNLWLATPISAFKTCQVQI